jgi:hypothetical protein
MAPLVTESLPSNIPTLFDRVTNVLRNGIYIARKLRRDTRYELGRMADISIATREEKASSETLFLKVRAGNCTSNSRLSRAS